MTVISEKIIKTLLVLAATFSFASISFAQNATIYITTTPNNPRAGDSVTLTVGSDMINLNSAKIVWYIDGVARKDTTSKTITIKAKTSGDSTSIRVVIETPDGVIAEASSSITPAGVDIVVEPVAYTMPFYEGKPFFVKQGTVRIIALPDVISNGTRLSSKDLYFIWSNNDTVLGDSGPGKDSITINGGIPIRDLNISVEVRDDTGAILAQNSKLIPAGDPSILFYENNPLLGILYNKAVVGNYFLGTREELDILAKPFSFSFAGNTPSNSSYDWYVNGSYVIPTGSANEMLLRQTTPNLKGTAAITLDLKSTNKVFQTATGGFNVQFGE